MNAKIADVFAREISIREETQPLKPLCALKMAVSVSGSTIRRIDRQPRLELRDADPQRYQGRVLENVAFVNGEFVSVARN